MNTNYKLKLSVLVFGAALLGAGCATISMTETQSLSLSATQSNQTPIQRDALDYRNSARAMGLASSQSGVEFFTQILVRGKNSIIPSDQTYRDHSDVPLEQRILDDTALLTTSLDALSAKANAQLAENKNIKRIDVMAFESAVITTDDARRTLTRTLEADSALGTKEISSAVEALSNAGDAARAVADSLAAAYTGDDGETGF